MTLTTAAVLVGVPVCLLVVAWLWRRLSPAPDELVLKPPVQRFGPLSAKDADTVRAAAKARQTRADHHHAEGRQIESGEPGTDRIIHLINGRGPRR